MDIAIRKAGKEDLPAILSLIKELAEYEKAAGEVSVTLEELEDDGFGELPLFEAIVAEGKDGEILGMAFYYKAYSTWKGKCIYLEDIIVKQSYRRKGIGKKLFDKVMESAYQWGAKRLMWQVLDWNTPAIEFYKKVYQAEISSEWLNGRLSRKQMEILLK